MISQSESGLSPAHYALLASNSESIKVKVVASRLLPEFTLTRNLVVSNGLKFDAVVHNGILYNAAAGVVESFNGFVWGSVSGFTEVGNQYSMLSEASGVTVYAHTGSEVKKNSHSGTWAGWSTVFSASNIQYHAAVAENAIHYVTKDNSKNVFRFSFRDAAGTVNSSIYWQYPIASFDAVRKDGKDYIVFTSESPGYLSEKVENGVAISYLRPAQGIFCIHYLNGIWSDPYMVDSVEELTPSKWRAFSRVMILDNKLLVTAYGVTGSGLNPVEFYRHYLSVDGRFWGKGDYLLAAAYKTGAVIIKYANVLYAFEHGLVYTSPPSYMLGGPSSANDIDVTDDILELSVGFAQMGDLRFSLDLSVVNYQTTFIFSAATVFTLYEGAWIDNALRWVQKGIFELDSLTVTDEETSRDGTANSLNFDVSARDISAWFITKTQSEDYLDREPIAARLDRYINATTTDYGGLAATAPLEGSWKTPATQGNRLVLASSEREGRAGSTLVSDIWNGSIRVSFQLPLETNEEYAGLMFRIANKDNYWSAAYKRNVDVIHLQQSEGGVVSFRASSGSMGWSNSNAFHWLRIDFQYALVSVYSSVNGVEWNLELEYISNGKIPNVYAPDGKLISKPLFSKGLTGLIGKAYSNQDYWNQTLPTVFPISSSLPTAPTIDPVSKLLVMPQNSNLLPGYVFAAGGASQAAVTTSISAINGTAIWKNISAGLSGDVYNGCIHSGNIAGRYLLTSAGVYHKADIYADDAWVLVGNNATILGNAARRGHKIVSHNNTLIVVCGQTGMSISTDQGATWTLSSLEYTAGGFYASMAAAAAAAIWATSAAFANTSDIVVSVSQTGEPLFYSIWFSGLNTTAVSCSPDGMSWEDSSNIPALGTAFNGHWRMSVPYKISADEYNDTAGSAFVDRAIIGVCSGTPNGYRTHKLTFGKNNAVPTLVDLNHQGPIALFRKTPISFYGKDGSRVVFVSTRAAQTAWGGVCISDDFGDTWREVSLNDANYHASITVSSVNKKAMLYWAEAGLFSSTGILLLTVDEFVTFNDIAPTFFTLRAIAYADMGMGF